MQIIVIQIDKDSSLTPNDLDIIINNQVLSDSVNIPVYQKQVGRELFHFDTNKSLVDK